MKIVDTRTLRGPNVFSTGPCFQVVLDLEALDGRACTDFAGFTERLVAALPTLFEHRCSRGHEGGFIERLREGTCIAHVVEHVLLELQCLAGTRVGFGCARAIPGRPRHYRVACAYRLESVVEAALPVAIEAVQALCRGETLDLHEDIALLRDIASHAALDPGTRAIVEAARRRGIPQVRVSEEASLVQLGWGRFQKRIQATVTSNTSRIAVEIAADMYLTKALLLEAGVPVPRGEVVSTAEQAVAAARRLGGVVAVKPLDASHGKGVSTALRSADEVRAAFERARRLRARVVVERHLQGDEHRVVVVNGEFLAAARCSPPLVVGDGERNVLELIRAENADPARGEGHGSALTRIPVDEATQEILARQGLSLDAIAPAGMRVVLRGNADLSTGGTAEDVTGRTHPDVAAACVRAARKIGLDVAGIDIICHDISRPLEEQGGGIVEVNAAPGIRMHEHPTRGERHCVGEAILETLYPGGHDGRVPLVAVTGTHGKTTTALLIAHAMQAAGLATGVATTEGIRIGEQQVRSGDCTGYGSARAVLSSPEVEAAVLETARGGILERGLGFDRCDVAVVLNVEDDRPGQDFVEPLEETARARRVVAGSASKAVVLNAGDARCVAMAPHIDPRARIVYFAMRDSNRVLMEHLERGGSAVYLRKGMVMMGMGEHRIPLLEASRIGFALGGIAQHNVCNALAATAALWACGFDRQRIAYSLATFRSTVGRNPLRLNMFTARGVRILLDCAHDASSYRALIGTARSLGARRVLGVVAAPGDRKDGKLREIGALCGRGFDETIAYDMDDRRGRGAGEVPRLLVRGALEAGVHAKRMAAVGDVRLAVRTAFERCQPGDLLVLGCASRVEDLTDAIPDAEEVTGIAPAPAHAEPAAAPAGLPAAVERTVIERASAVSPHH